MTHHQDTPGSSPSAASPFSFATYLEGVVRKAASGIELLGPDFDPILRTADPRFGDFQANGVLPVAKKARTNPRQLAESLAANVREALATEGVAIEVEVAGPGFLNLRLSPQCLLQWLETHASRDDLAAGAGSLLAGRRVVIDFSSPNTAKEMHVGHIRSTVIGEVIARLLAFAGAKVVRDNHLGDWGTQFGMLIWAVKDRQVDLDALGDDALVTLEELYRAGHAHYKSSDEAAHAVREELLLLQQGDATNFALWKKITEVSWTAFQKLYDLLDVHFDCVLGESHYRAEVDALCEELKKLGIAEEDKGALVVWHDGHPRFGRDNKYPQPFIIRKQDGASNYGTTDLATARHRVREFSANELIYVVDARQSDHFEQLFLTVKRWFEATGVPVPAMQHVSFGTVLGSDGKPIKTKEGGSIKLRELLAEAIERATAIVAEKNPDLAEAERNRIGEVVGIGAIKYADLAQNRSSDYLFSWEKMLSLEGNTAPYLLYAVARIHSIFRKMEITPGQAEEAASTFETETEIALARKLVGFPSALDQAISDLRPHHLATYLYDVASTFSTFYNADKVMGVEKAVSSRRILLVARTLLVLQTGLELLSLETLERM